MNDAEYTRLREKYNNTLRELLAEYSQKYLCGVGGLTQSTISGYVNRGTLPDVVIGAMIADRFHLTVEQMVGIKPIEKPVPLSPELQSIVDLLRPLEANPEALIEIRGVVRRQVKDLEESAPETSSRKASEIA